MTTATATLRALHRAAVDMQIESPALYDAVSSLLADAVSNADDNFASEDDVCDEAWSQAALNTLEMLLGSGDAVASPAARRWFIAQGFTF
jgi:hypothetical protein